jgi:uncharacterized protein (TIGR00251 family)
LKTIQLKVKPNSRISTLEEVADGPWLARVKAPPIDGKANEELIALIARHFDCPKSAVFIKSGASGRLKLVRIDEEKICRGGSSIGVAREELPPLASRPDRHYNLALPPPHEPHHPHRR